MRFIKSIKIVLSRFLLWKNKVWNKKNHFALPFWLNLKLKFSGFLSDQYVWYNFKNNDYHEYINEVERWKSRNINRRYNMVADDKLLFTEIFHKYVPIPLNLCWIYKGIINNLAGENINDTELLELISTNSKLIAKPVIQGGSGKGIHILSYFNNDYLFDNKILNRSEICKKIRSLQDYVIVEYVRQHSYSSKIFPHSVNTIRVITIYNEQTGKAKITHKIHRIGVNSCIPVDNAMKGALIAKIDDNYKLSAARTLNDISIYPIHPDTGAQIEGISIPHLKNVQNELIKVAEKLPYIPFISWDVVIIEEEPYYNIIEVNASTGLNFVQIWNGERNTELGNFFRKHGIIKK